MDLKNLLPALALLIMTGVSYAGKVETIGKTYPVAEKDALEEIEERAKNVDWDKAFDKKKWEKAVKEYAPPDMAKLPHVKKDRVRQVDMTYTLDIDIPDEKGNIIYPRGYTFNPIDYVTLDQTLMVIDSSSKSQVEWFKKSPYFKSGRTMLLISGGSWFDLMENLGMAVYYLPDVLKDRFKLEAVPSVIEQKGRVMEVREIYVKEDGK